MAFQSRDPVTGAYRFTEDGAPELGADLTLVAEQAAAAGTRPIGTTAEMNAYAFKRKGLAWGNTSTGTDWVYDGSKWVNTMELANIPLALTGDGNFTLTGTAVRRRGQVVALSGAATNARLVTFGDTYVTVGRVPLELAPLSIVSITAQSNNWRPTETLVGEIRTTGDVNLRAASGTVTGAIGKAWSFNSPAWMI
ncbi:hypothetical protein D9V32_05570 [Mycetocola tolaasinivorans]|uniref:Uncharacterized protein n=1 Tax=Mycetocola tolaasinivorans TaxID=76635 RepID=A0A3L7A7P1_9MICO|nr:hypothetical protein [Mycetocola tolaasinivorans]RLP76339.1 hypothetical protein D9V32_05570 [Mycetocola tolaasinivorans]